MEHKIAKLIHLDLAKKGGPKLSFIEATRMTELFTDGMKVYALQKDDATFLAWVSTNGFVRTKIVSW